MAMHEPDPRSLDEALTRITELGSDLEELEQENSRLDDEVYSLNQRVEELEYELDDAQSTATRLQSELEEMEDDRDYWQSIADS